MKRGGSAEVGWAPRLRERQCATTSATGQPTTLDRVAGELSALSELADVSDPLGDVAGAILVCREDLDALEALDYSDAED